MLTQNMDIMERLKGIVSQFRPELPLENGMDKLPLTGEPFWLSAEEMVYLLYEIEQAFQVEFTEADLLDYGFSTLQKIKDHLQVKTGEINVAMYKS